MLAPDDRVVLREQLRPEPGHELDLAVATTFTLDLTAALVAPLAFAAFDVAGTSDPIAVLEAVRSATEKVTIFCQAGQRRVPATPSDLMAFLEPMVHDVRAPIPGYLFHPKLWVLRYRSPVAYGPTYRLLCGTRNLTDDVSWDAMVRIDGVPGTRRQRSNGPLVDLVRLLPQIATGDLARDRRAAILDLAEELRSVEWDRPPGVTAMTFHALGLQRRRGRTSYLVDDAMRGRRHLIVSPFLDDAAIEAITDGDQERILVSRPEALERLDPATLQGTTCHILNPMAGIAEPDEAEDPRRHRRHPIPRNPPRPPQAPQMPPPCSVGCTPRPTSSSTTASPASSSARPTPRQPGSSNATSSSSSSSRPVARRSASICSSGPTPPSPHSCRSTSRRVGSNRRRRRRCARICSASSAASPTSTSPPRSHRQVRMARAPPSTARPRATADLTITPPTRALAGARRSPAPSPSTFPTAWNCGSGCSPDPGRRRRRPTRPCTPSSVR